MDRGHFLDIAESQDAHVCESKHAARGGRKGERRSVRSQAPPLLRQRKPYLTGSPPSRRERRWRQDVAWGEYSARSGRCENRDLFKFWVGARESQLPLAGHSWRRAIMGSTRVARRAGT